jgi:hypothetical protein
MNQNQSMISRKRLLTIVVSVCVGTAIYLYYVKKEREASIAHYFPHPQTGDIYKMRSDIWNEGVKIFYLKIKDIDAENIYFYPSRLVAGAMHDSFLKHFDTTQTKTFSKNELAEIVAGKWMIRDKDMTQLLEIERTDPAVSGHNKGKD